ncbi:hypothetical protein GTP58_28310 [Duganella sp. CY15W]|uniref:hypothetical protein n=1 Tax=Duganella sp. CY15W TaxID=2692172 RepID=UPI0013705943|nr:hypothetical protein [Duganella sp. CY15W]MYM32242.1 hypothetical protein [Duganella sp. CY15W]
MEQATVTLIVGLTGIIATAVVGSIGHYFTAKARTAPLRQSLFAKQLELVMEIANLQSRVRVLATILSSDIEEHIEQAREDIAEYVKQFCEAEEKGAVILPVELWLEVKGLSNSMGALLIEFDSSGTIRSGTMTDMVARIAKVALLCRIVVGSDKLTGQSIDLFYGKSSYDNAAKLEISEFERMHSRVNGKDVASDL